MSTSRPILFSGPMILALLSGVKSQTRRVVKAGAYHSDIYSISSIGVIDGSTWVHLTDAAHAGLDVRCPYGVPGDQLWVRETFSHHVGADALNEPAYCDYRADRLPDDAAIRWTPSIFMPRWASRITLEITDVRVERLNDISEKDAIAEGAHRKIWITSPMSAGAMNARGVKGSFRDGYKDIWEEINGAGSWALNPWVWSISFRRITP